MRKFFFMIVILSIFLISCEKETIKIGLVTTLSGSNSEIGVSIRDSLLLRVDEVNADGGIKGRKIEVIIRDDRNDPELIVRHNKELKELGVDVYFGYELSSKYAVIEQMLEEDVIVISPTLSSHLASEKNDNFFRTISTNKDQGVTLAEYANELNSNTLIIYDENNSAYALGVIEGFDDAYKGKTTLYGISDKLVDREAEILDAYEGHDSILLIFNPNDCASIAQMFYRKDIEVDIYSSSWGMVSDGYLAAGKAMEGTVFASHIGDDRYPSYLEFVSSYKDKYFEEPQFAAVYAYEAAIMYFTALENSDDFELDSVRASLLALDHIDGIISELQFDEYGDIERSNYIAVLVDGELIIKE